MNRHFRRRQARMDRDTPKIRLARTMPVADAAAALGGCDCPALVTTGAGLVTVEHYHRHGCRSLYRMMREEAS